MLEKSGLSDPGGKRFPARRRGISINNEIYFQSDLPWFAGEQSPFALLRAENRFRKPWIESVLQKNFTHSPISVLDLGCGAGLLAGPLGESGLQVTGLDCSAQALELAEKRFGSSSKIRWIQGDALRTGLESGGFDVVLAMDVLEHIPQTGGALPENAGLISNAPGLVREASRLLKPGGLFFFHTFNRSWIARLLAIHGVEWLLPETPPNLHVYELFIKPRELISWCQANALETRQILGVRPDFFSRSFLKLLLRSRVDENFRFRFSKSLAVGYMGYAQKCG